MVAAVKPCLAIQSEIVSRGIGRWAILAAGLLVGVVAGPLPAMAIPSPELVVGSLTSLSQLVAVVSAVLGGGAIAAGARYRGARATGGPASPWPVRVALGAIVLAVAGFGLALHLHLSHSAERRQRLEATLLRPPPRSADGGSLDKSLKEVPYRAQIVHPLGVATEEAARIVGDVAAGAARDTVLLDIRESAETEMGSLPGAVAVRFPDLADAKLDLAGKRVLVFCHNGNRSAESCMALAEKGIDCGFIVGGLEKWLAEGRRLGGAGARSLKDLRALPEFPNQDVLLETEAVRHLIRDEGAILVDVRYPGEFAATHLPEAINIPFRPTPSAELARRLDALPAHPVVAPCYDRRSCFFASVLGLELARRGRDFRGRYTLPWEYFEPAKRPPYVEALQARAGAGWWQSAARWLGALLADVSRSTGLPLALALLALASRLVVLPFSTKAERDSAVSRTIAGEVAALKRRLADDPPRLGRALRALYRRHGMTPGFNLIALAFLPVLALSVEAATLAAEQVPTEVRLIGNLAARDATLLLPLAFAVLIALYVELSMVGTGRQRLLVWALLAPLMAVAAALLSAAADVYMVASAGLLLVQRWLAGVRPRERVPRLHGRLAARRRSRLERLGVVSLARPDLLVAAGNKAYRLARLAAIGLPVPDGLVLTADFLSRLADLGARQRRRALARVWRGLSARRIAVRSSAAAEDGADASFAGVFETVLDVERAGLEAAIETVTGSFASARAASYRGGGGGAANVLLQPMVAARWSGVLFTEAPQSPALMLVEIVQGTADKLVSGQVAPEAFLIGRASRTPVGAAPPIDLAPLAALALAAEAELGAPQDIEWAHDGCRFLLLQSRDITAAGNAASAEVRDEWRRLARVLGRDPAAGVVLAQTEMAEMLPRPTPLSLGLVEALWKPGGGVDRAARALGLVYPVGEDAAPYHLTAFGRLYVDKREERARAIKVPRATARALARNAGRIEDRVRREFLPRLLAEVRPLEVADFERLPIAEVLALVRRTVQRYVCETHAEVEMVNIAARFLVDEARQRLDAAGADAPRLLATIPPTHLDEQLRRLQLAPAELRGELMIEALGHRARLDYELAEPRYGEDRAALEAAVETALAAQWSLLAGLPQPRGDELAPPRGLEQVVRRARRFQTLKEDAKHHALRELAVLRNMLLVLDRRLGFGGAIFDLELDELLGLDGRNVAACKRGAVARGIAIERVDAERPLGFELTVADVEAASLGAPDMAGAADGDLAGLRVAGLGLAEGRAIVVDTRAAETGAPITAFADGDIIVAPMIHPAWLPLVLRAGGVVAEVGGWLSHMSIIAREHNIAMIVGVKGIGRISTGDRLRLLDDGRIAVAT